jgi:hypothetical protein
MSDRYATRPLIYSINALTTLFRKPKLNIGIFFCIIFVGCGSQFHSKTENQPSSCNEAAALRGKLPTLYQQGKLLTSYRLLRHANSLCPSARHTTWKEEAFTLASLGMAQELRDFSTWQKTIPELTKEYELHRIPIDTLLHETQSLQVHPETLLEKARIAHLAKNNQKFHRFLGQATVALERDTKSLATWQVSLPKAKIITQWLNRDQRLALTSDRHTISIREGPDWQETHRLTHPTSDPIHSLEPLKNASAFYSISRFHSAQWDSKPLFHLGNLFAPIQTPRPWSRSASGTYQVWFETNPRMLKVWKNDSKEAYFVIKTPANHSQLVESNGNLLAEPYYAEFSHNEKLLVVFWNDHQVTLLDLISKQQRELPITQHVDEPTTFLFSPDDSMLYVGSSLLWDIKNDRQIVFRKNTNCLSSHLFHPTEPLLIEGGKGSLVGCMLNWKTKVLTDYSQSSDTKEKLMGYQPERWLGGNNQGVLLRPDNGNHNDIVLLWKQHQTVQSDRKIQVLSDNDSGEKNNLLLINENKLLRLFDGNSAHKKTTFQPFPYPLEQVDSHGFYGIFHDNGKLKLWDGVHSKTQVLLPSLSKEWPLDRVTFGTKNNTILISNGLGYWLWTVTPKGELVSWSAPLASPQAEPIHWRDGVLEFHTHDGRIRQLDTKKHQLHSKPGANIEHPKKTCDEKTTDMARKLGQDTNFIWYYNQANRQLLRCQQSTGELSGITIASEAIDRSFFDLHNRWHLDFSPKGNWMLAHLRVPSPNVSDTLIHLSKNTEHKLPFSITKSAFFQESQALLVTKDAITSSESLALLDLATQSLLWKVPISKEFQWVNLQFSGDGKWGMLLGKEGSTFQVFLYHTQNGKLSGTFSEPPTTSSIAWLDKLPIVVIRNTYGFSFLSAPLGKRLGSLYVFDNVDSGFFISESNHGQRKVDGYGDPRFWGQFLHCTVGAISLPLEACFEREVSPKVLRDVFAIPSNEAHHG